MVKCGAYKFLYDKHKFLFADGITPFIIPSASGGYVVGHNNKLCHLDWETEKFTTLLEVEEGTGNTFNDAKCDAKGRLWAGIYRSVYSLICFMLMYITPAMKGCIFEG